MIDDLTQTPNMDKETVVVRVKQGFLEGRLTTTKSGGSLVTFQGIPYAKPPVGNLRFKPPELPNSWTGTYKAFQEPPICPQFENGIFIGQEDCLYLNVYTQKVEVDELKPVMVWIHGGGFVKGSGNTDLYGPDFLVDAGVILVTFNYRLAVLGFLGLDNADVSGNMGLKDQVAVLRWIQNNISAFGGSPDNVTLFGESAGGVSVNYHMFSLMTKGLFHKAIAQSGSCLNPWAFTKACRVRSFRLGELLGFKTKDARKLLDFLQKVEIEKLVKACDDVLPRMDNTSGLKIVFVPTVEPIIEGQEQYLTEHPGVLLKNKKFHELPYITGTVTHEGMINLRGVLKNPSLLKTLNDKFELALPGLLKINLSKEERKELADKVKKFYLGNETLSMNTIISFLNYHTDVQMASGIYLTAKEISLSSRAPVYFYNFGFDGELGCAKKAMGHQANIISGPYHGDDIGYLFRLGLYDPDLEPDSWEVKIRNKMVKLWTDFAKTGSPTPVICEELPIKWLPFTASEEKYLNIDVELSMKTNLRETRMKFWETVNQAKL